MCCLDQLWEASVLRPDSVLVHHSLTSHRTEPFHERRAFMQASPQVTVVNGLKKYIKMVPSCVSVNFFNFNCLTEIPLLNF